MPSAMPITSTLPVIRGPIVEQNRNATVPMIKWLQKLEAKTNTSLSLIGEITGIFSGIIKGEVTSVTGTAAVLSSLTAILQNLDQLGVVLPPGVDFTRSYTAKNSDQIPSGSTTIIPTQTRMNRATDTAGNLLLKNIANAAGVTSNPTTSSASPVLMPDMTATITTQGNKIYISWGVGFRTSTTGGTVFMQIYRDGTGIGPIMDGSSVNNVGQNTSMAASWIDAVSAGSHTYEIRWWTTPGTTATADLVNRAMELVELG